MDAQTCIYCKETKGKSEFNREHVVPQSFGRFEGNLVLRKVCRECNGVMGKDLDQFLARDTLVGLLRFLHRVRPIHKANDYPWSMITVALEEPGEFYDARVELVFDGDQEPTVRLAPQVGIRKRAGGWAYFSLKELEIQGNISKRSDLAPDIEIRIMCPTDQVASFKGLLAREGVEFREQGSFRPTLPREGERVRAEIRNLMTRTLQRAVCKITFNYLAHVTESDPAFVLKEAFDPVRNFVRYGNELPKRLVGLVRNPFFKGGRLRDGHFLGVRWFPKETSIRAGVSFFGRVTYGSILSDSTKLLWRDISSTHFYDLEKMKVFPVMKGVVRPVFL
jgi:hypothetical protein